MSRARRLTLAAALAACGLVVATAAVATYAVERSGTFRLAVHEKGQGGASFSMSLPGILLDAAIAICPIPKCFEAEAGNARLRDVAPVLQVLADELDRIPDSVILDVRDGDERVSITKEGSVLRIRVAAPDERVDIDMPVASLRHALERLSSVRASARA